MTTCPIGLYYSFVAPGDHFGIHFREATKDGSKDACLHCNACINVCPVDLNPMDLAENATPRGGIAIEAPGQNHCLKCGDCIQACEMMIQSTAKKRGITEVPLKFGLFQGSQRLTRTEQNQKTTDSQQQNSVDQALNSSPATENNTTPTTGSSPQSSDKNMTTLQDENIQNTNDQNEEFSEYQQKSRSA